MARRSKVVLAFGRHASSSIQADRGFFEKSLSGALEQVEKGRKATMILEFLVRKRLDHEHYSMHQDEADGKLQSELDRAKEFINSSLEYAITNGMTEDDGDHGLVMDFLEKVVHFGTWGFEDRIVAVNRRRPGAMRIVIEPQSASAAIADFFDDLYGDYVSRNLHDPGVVDMLVKQTFWNIRMQVLRDSLLVRLAESIAEEDPGGLIMIPRGFEHRFMRVLFHPDIFDVESFESCAVKMPNAKLMESAYQGRVDMEELTRFAKIMVEMMRYFVANDIDEGDEFRNFEGALEFAKSKVGLG